MSNLFRNLASRGGLSFAHLGRNSRASDDTPSNDDDDDSKGKKGKRASEDDDDGQNREDGDSKKGKRASDDDDDDDAGARAEEEDDDERDSGKGKRGKRAAEDDDDERAEDDDDDEEEMRGNSAVARARRRERARCAAIFASKGAGRNPEMACKLAFTTRMTRSEAISVLSDTPAAEGGRSRRQNPNLGAGGESSISPQQAASASWDRAFLRAGSKARKQR